MTRPVDSAMGDERRDKVAIRHLWADEYETCLSVHNDDARPVYLTLPGSHGRDIGVLVERELVQLTENGQISPVDAPRIVAVESSSEAVISLLEKYAGLKVIEERLEAALRSTGPTRWPEAKHEPQFRATLVNLDFDKPFKAEVDQGIARFPAAQMVSKLAQLHAKEPQIDWTLCLTLNATLLWDETTSEQMRTFITENCDREPRFRDGALSVLGEPLLQAILAGTGELPDLASEDSQRLLMVLVPKHLAAIITAQGWRLHTRRNLRYGGVDGAAPMVTWIIDFRWDTRVNAQPDAVYRDSIAAVFDGVGTVLPDGSLET